MAQTQQNSQQSTTKMKHTFPSLAENINYIENKLFHSDDLKNSTFLFKTEKERCYTLSL